MKVVYHSTLQSAINDVNRYAGARLRCGLPPLKIFSEGDHWVIDNPDYDKWVPSFLGAGVFSSPVMKQSHPNNPAIGVTSLEEVLSSDGVTIYRVQMKGNRATACPCKGFLHRNNCRHLEEAMLKRLVREEGQEL